MQVRDPTASLYICQLGSQPAENLFSITRTLNHNRNFDVLQLRDRLQAVLDIQDIFLAHPDWRKRHQRYATDRLTPLEYTADCSVQSVDLKKVWERGTARATTILEQHPQIGSSAHNVLESLYQGGATLLKPCGAPHILACGPQKQQNFVCFVERPLLWQGCVIMWQCTCRKERW